MYLELLDVDLKYAGLNDFWKNYNKQLILIKHSNKFISYLSKKEKKFTSFNLQKTFSALLQQFLFLFNSLTRRNMNDEQRTSHLIHMIIQNTELLCHRLYA